MQRLLSLQEIFKSSIERTVLHLNDTITRNSRSQETTNILKERELFDRLRQIEHNMAQLDHEKLVTIFSNKTMTLRRDLVEIMLEIKQKFKDAEKHYQHKQIASEETAQTFMKKIQNSIIEIKQDYARLTEKTSKLTFSNMELANRTTTYQNEFRDNSRLTKLQLSDLDNQIFNGLRNIRDEKDQLAAEIALQDGLIIYLKENAVKITDSTWLEILDIQEIVEELRQNSDDLKSQAIDRANILTINVEKKLSSQREKLLDDMGKLVAQIEKVKLDVQHQDSELSDQIQTNQMEMKKTLVGLKSTIEAEVVRRIHLQHEVLQKSTSDLEQKFMTLQLDVIKVSDTVEESTKFEKNITHLSSKIKKMDGKLSTNVVELSLRLDTLNKQMAQMADNSDLSSESREMLTKMATNIATNQQTISAVTRKIPELEIKLNNLKLTRTSAANQLTDRVLDTVETLSLRVEKFNGNVTSMQIELKEMEGNIDKFKKSVEHDKQVQRQKYQLLTSQIKDNDNVMISSVTHTSNAVKIVEVAQASYDKELEKINNNIKLFETQLGQFSVLNDDTENLKNNLSVFTDRLSNGFDHIAQQIRNVSEIDSIHYDECKADFTRLNNKAISNTNSLENFRRDIRSYATKFERLSTTDDETSEEIYKLQVAQNEYATNIQEYNAKYERVNKQLNKTVSAAKIRPAIEFDENGLINRLNNLFAKKTEVNNDMRDIRGRLTGSSVSIKSIIEDSYSLLNSKIGAAEEKIANSSQLNENFRRSLFTTIENLDERVESNILKLSKLNTEHTRLDRRETARFNELNITFGQRYDQVNDKINSMIHLTADSNVELATTLKDEITAIIGAVAKETGSNLHSINANKEKLGDIDQTVENIQRGMNIQLQKINNLSKGIESTKPGTKMARPSHKFKGDMVRTYLERLKYRVL